MIRRPNGQSNAQKEAEAAAKKKKEIEDKAAFIAEHWDEKDWLKELMSEVGKSWSVAANRKTVTSKKLAEMLVEKGVDFAPGGSMFVGLSLCQSVENAVCVVAGMVEGLLGRLGAEKKFKRRLITAYGEVVAVLRVVQIFRWPRQNQHSQVARVMAADMEWCMARTLDRMGDNCDEGEAAVYALVGEYT